MERIDSNGDGMINYAEFAAKFKSSSFDSRMAARAADRMAKLKELMCLHMTSANDAFRFVSAISTLVRLGAQRASDLNPISRFRFQKAPSDLNLRL